MEDSEKTSGIPDTKSEDADARHPDMSETANVVSVETEAPPDVDEDGSDGTERTKRIPPIVAFVSLVFGIVAIILSVVPRSSGFAPAVGCLGLIAAVLGFIIALRGACAGRMISIIGAVLSIVAIFLSFMTPGNSAPSDQGPSTNASEQQDSREKENYGMQDLEGMTASSYVKIGQPARSVTDMSGKNTVLITYEWENQSGHKASFNDTLTATVTQNGQVLQTALYEQNPEGYKPKSQTAKIKNAEKASVTFAYALADDSPITVNIVDQTSEDGGSIISHTFDSF